MQFNAIFSSARQAVERVFGILQKKWYLLVIGCEYDIQDYMMFLQGIMLIHNFMVSNESTDSMSIMNGNWQFDGEPIDLQESIDQLNLLISDEKFIDEYDHRELALGKQRRD